MEQVFVFVLTKGFFFPIAAMRAYADTSDVYSVHSPNVCTSLIVTINAGKAEASCWVQAVGVTPHTWKREVGGVQGNAVAKSASSSHIKHVDVLIMTVLTGEAPANWVDWVPLGYGWACASLLAAPTLTYEAAPKTVICTEFTRNNQEV